MGSIFVGHDFVDVNMNRTRLRLWYLLLGIVLMLGVFLFEINTHVLETVGYLAAILFFLWVSGVVIIAFVLNERDRMAELKRARQDNEDLEKRVLERTSEMKRAFAESEEMNRRLQGEIQDRIRIEEALEASQHLHTAIAANFPNGWIGVLNENLEFEFIDGKGMEGCEIKPDMMLGEKFVTHFHSPKIEEFLRDSFGGKIRAFEMRCATNVCEVDAVSFPNGKQLLVLIHDITKRKKVEQELTAALARERELSDMKSKFVTLASHEFRTPLTTILSSSYLLNHYTGEKFEHEKAVHLGRINHSVTVMTDILNDFLSLGKLEEGNIAPVSDDLDVNAFLQELTKEMEGHLGEGQRITVAHTGAERVTTDKKLLRNILFNLLSNAIKYSPANDCVVVESKATKELLAIKVIDHGLGIPESDRKNIFKRFYRASNVSNIEGTGLGLNITRKYLQLLGGSIEFSSEPGVETVFSITIPLPRSDDALTPDPYALQNIGD